MNKVAVITAASKGIGGVTATAFSKNGYDVVINYHSDDAAAKQIIKEVEADGNKALAVKSDIFTEEGVNKLFKTVEKEFGKIDVLVNNPGNPNEPALGEYTFQNIVDSLSGNFISSVLCTQAAVPLMKDGGSILFTSSIYGLSFAGNPGLAIYSAGKAAIINFSQTMAEKLAPNIRCNVVAPGTTRTPSWDNVAQEYVDKSLSMTLQKEWVAPEEIAEAFLFLANTPHITAQTIIIDAGWQKKIRENSPKRH
jgi:3-oxoacyl-[acyl-carrier protein] reductase